MRAHVYVYLYTYAHFCQILFSSLINKLVQTTPPVFSTPGNAEPDHWSTLIGVITAVTGNVLLSVALNLQKIAHIRINRSKRDALFSNLLITAPATPSLPDSINYIDSDNPLLCVSSIHDDLSSQLSRRHTSPPLLTQPQDPNCITEFPAFPPHDISLSIPRSHLHPENPDTTISDNSKALINHGPVRSSHSYLRSPIWWTGFILMAVGELGNFIAYGFAPASIISPLGVVALVLNCVIAPLVLKECFRKRDFLGVLLAIAGAITVVLSAESNNPKLGPRDIWGLISTRSFLLYTAITLSLVIFLASLSATSGTQYTFIDLGLVALFGGYTALSTKAVASMLSSSPLEALQFPGTYILLIILVSTAILQVKYINRALQRFDSTLVIPIQFVLFTLSVIFGSAILFRDFESADFHSAIKFTGGCTLTFLGVWLIASKRSIPPDHPYHLPISLASNTENCPVEHQQIIPCYTDDTNSDHFDGFYTLSLPMSLNSSPIHISSHCNIGLTSSRQQINATNELSKISRDLLPSQPHQTSDT